MFKNASDARFQSSSYGVINSESSSCELGFAAQLRQKFQALRLDLGPLLTEETRSEQKDEQLDR